jgi:methyl-accepting chemotaxis protein
MKLRDRIRLSAGISIFLLIVVLLVLYPFTLRLAKEKALAIVKLLTHEASLITENILKENDRIFERWTLQDIYGPAIEFEQIEDLKGTFSQMLKTAPYFCGLYLFDIKFKPLLKVSHCSEDIPLTSSVIKSGKKIVSTFMVYATQVKDTSGNPNGWLVGVVSLKKLDKPFTKVREKFKEYGFHTGTLSLFTESGKSILGSELSEEFCKWEEFLKNGLKVVGGVKKSEVKIRVYKVLGIVLFIGVVGIFVLIMNGVFMYKAIVVPLAQIKTALEALSRGDLTYNITITSQDEIGEMARALSIAINQLKEMLLNVVNGTEKLKEVVKSLDFANKKVVEEAGKVGEGSKSIEKHAEDIAGQIEEVAGAFNQMTAAIQEIAKSTVSFKTIAQQAMDLVQTIQGAVEHLSSRSKEITDVVNFVNNIAEQTNLLALNAAIEAARAGEAGKGFAVVANEVKELAKQTGGATEEISQKIQVIQQNISEIVNSISAISQTVENVNLSSQTIAAAIEEQNVTIAQLSENAQQSVQYIKQINEELQKLTQIGESLNQVVIETAKSIKNLTQTMENLELLVSKFKF